MQMNSEIPENISARRGCEQSQRLGSAGVSERHSCTAEKLRHPWRVCSIQPKFSDSAYPALIRSGPQQTSIITNKGQRPLALSLPVALPKCRSDRLKPAL